MQYYFLTLEMSQNFTKNPSYQGAGSRHERSRLSGRSLHDSQHYGSPYQLPLPLLLPNTSKNRNSKQDVHRSQRSGPPSVFNRPISCSMVR